MRLVKKSVQRRILATVLVGGLAVTLLADASAALADNSHLDAMASAAKPICNNLGASGHPQACVELQNDLTSCTSTTVPDMYQLTQAIEATSEAESITGTGIGSYASPAWSQMQLYRFTYTNPQGQSGTALAPQPGGTTAYYDDNAWAGVALVNLYHQTGDQTYLDAAEQRYIFETTGQRTGSDGSDTGIWWNTNRPYISAGSTGGAIRLALMLYQTSDGTSNQLTFAKQNYEWARSHLMTDPNNPNLYVDQPGVTTESPAHEAWFIDDGRLLYDITGDSSYLTQATDTANGTENRFGSSAYNNYSADEFAGMFASFVRLSTSAYATPLQDYVSNWLDPNTSSGDFNYPNDSKTGCNEEIKQQAGAAWTYALHQVTSG